MRLKSRTNKTRNLRVMRKTWLRESISIDAVSGTQGCGDTPYSLRLLVCQQDCTKTKERISTKLE